MEHFPRVFRTAAARRERSARRIPKRIGADTSIIEAQFERQITLERESTRGFLYYSQAIEEAAAVACRNTAVVCGSPHNEEPLGRLGQMYGRIVYLLDSYRDHRRDVRAGKFNPRRLRSRALA